MVFALAPLRSETALILVALYGADAAISKNRVPAARFSPAFPI